MDDKDYWKRVADTNDVLRTIDGGSALLDRFGGEPPFGDSEIVEFSLVRDATSRLVINLFSSAETGSRVVKATFNLQDVLFVNLEGFSHQNVIGGLYIEYAGDSVYHPSLLGIGINRPDHAIEIEPCAGAFGQIRATIKSITLSPA